MGRSPCCEKAHTNKGAWSKEEDERLMCYIRSHGEGCWRSLPKAAGLMRCGKSCRLRWINYLRPDLKRGNFTQQEDELIIKLHSLLGNKWSLIAGRLAGRTDNEIKNYWNTHIRRKLINRGIDPTTHRPINQPPYSHPQQQQQQQATTISFGTTSTAEHHHMKVKAEDDEGCLNISVTSFCGKDENIMNKDEVIIDQITYCPDLNLDLEISPPHPQPQPQPQPQQHHQPDHHMTSFRTGGSSRTTLCFACTLGLQNSKDCTCTTATATISNTNNITTAAYDFLGLKAAVFDDYTSLEMK